MTQKIVNPLFFSPGEPKGLPEDGSSGYPAYAACSQSPGGSWTGVAAGPGAYMGAGQASPGAVAAPGGATPLSSQQQQQGGAGTPQTALPSPLYPWMRSQFGERRIN